MAFLEELVVNQGYQGLDFFNVLRVLYKYPSRLARFLARMTMKKLLKLHVYRHLLCLT